MKTIQEARQELSLYKEKETVMDIPSNSTEIMYHLDEKNVHPWLRKKGEKFGFSPIPQAFGQYLELVCGPGAKAVWNYAVNSPKDIIEEQLEDAREMLQMKVDRTRKMVRLHGVTLEEGHGPTIMGVTSDRHTKIYDADLLNSLSSIMGEDAYATTMFDPDVTAIDFNGGSFPAPDGLDFSMQVRIRNNQWGRHSLVIQPMILRKICSNGATIPISGTTFVARHVGDVNIAYMQTAVRTITTKFEELKMVVFRSFETKVETEKTLKKVSEKFQMGKKEMERVSTFLAIEKYPNTLYGVANAVARLANESVGEKRITLQAVAGKIYSGI